MTFSPTMVFVKGQDVQVSSRVQVAEIIIHYFRVVLVRGGAKSNPDSIFSQATNVKHGGGVVVNCLGASDDQPQF